MKALLLLLCVGLFSAQSLQPTIGLGWTGGLSYEMEHEVPSAKIGLLYSPKKSKVITNLELSGSYYYNFLTEKRDAPTNTFYVVRVQASKEVIEYWNVTAYGGYINSFDNNLMKSYKNGNNRASNIAWGVGIQTFDDWIVGEILYENLAGYSHLSVGVTYKFKSVIKKK